MEFERVGAGAAAVVERLLLRAEGRVRMLFPAL